MDFGWVLASKIYFDLWFFVRHRLNDVFYKTSVFPRFFRCFLRRALVDLFFEFFEGAQGCTGVPGGPAGGRGGRGAG